jgi:hypothetical protein
MSRCTLMGDDYPCDGAPTKEHVMETNPPEPLDLDEEEKQILAAFQSGNFKLGKPSKSLVLLAKETLRKSKSRSS